MTRMPSARGTDRKRARHPRDPDARSRPIASRSRVTATPDRVTRGGGDDLLVDPQAAPARRDARRRRPPRGARLAARDPRPWPFRSMPRQRALRVATLVLALMGVALIVLLSG